MCQWYSASARGRGNLPPPPKKKDLYQGKYGILLYKVVKIHEFLMTYPLKKVLHNCDVDATTAKSQFGKVTFIILLL